MINGHVIVITYLILGYFCERIQSSILTNLCYQFTELLCATSDEY